MHIRICVYVYSICEICTDSSIRICMPIDSRIEREEKRNEITACEEKTTTKNGL